jgi:hypothetical protein
LCIREAPIRPYLFAVRLHHRHTGNVIIKKYPAVAAANLPNSSNAGRWLTRSIGRARQPGRPQPIRGRGRHHRALLPVVRIVWMMMPTDPRWPKSRSEPTDAHGRPDHHALGRGRPIQMAENLHRAARPFFLIDNWHPGAGLKKDEQLAASVTCCAHSAGSSPVRCPRRRARNTTESQQIRR